MAQAVKKGDTLPQGLEVTRRPLGRQRLDGVDLPTDEMVLNMGPAHPATHGTVHIKLTLDGEKIRQADVNVGYLHRGFEKEAEAHTWAEIFPYTDRLNYVSPMLNNIGYALAVEKLLGISAPKRAQWLCMIVGELARLADHLTCMAAQVMEVGAFTPYFYVIKCREWIWDLLEAISGARLTHSYVRVGGVAADMPENFDKQTIDIIDRITKVIDEFDALMTRNRIFMDRMMHIAVISGEDAINYGWTGPCLRGSGVDYDIRKVHPYLAYDEVDFEVPIGINGDNMDRYLVRLEEMRQSIHIIHQCFAKMPEGPVAVDNPRVMLPPKREAYNSIEGMINHFKLVVDGIEVPAGESYSYTEAGNGELGFYLVSDGSGRPVKCRVRPPCFMQMTAMGDILRDHLLADIIPTFDTLNMIGGECDR
ncbi:MAG: NADH-quinone oxidoreductase subunit D [Deltaproteobacteria bacterium]|nr:NADH-quinone oxidoreductase subunit D [Deltaproteobacteria bacterium]